MEVFFIFSFLSTLLHHAHASASANSTVGFSLKLLHWDNPESPLYQANLTAVERHWRLLRFSKTDMRWLESSIGEQHPLDTSSIRPIIQQERGSYTVQVFIGTPSGNYPLHLVFSSEFDLTWTQTHPCTHCFEQDPPRYSHSASTTHAFVPCDDSFCLIPQRHQCINNRCVYTMQHGRPGYERKYTGYLSRETIAFESKNGGREAIPGLVFGATYESNDKVKFPSRAISGVMGIGGGRLSLMEQLSARTGGRFSYCLLSLDVPLHSYLRFGNDIVMPRNAQRTKITPGPQNVRYYLHLIDLSFNGHRLNINPDVFKVPLQGRVGIVISTAIVFTHFVSPVYQLLRWHMQSYFRQLSLVEIKIEAHGHDFLCYRMPRGFDRFPTMTLHFQDGAHLLLSSKNLFLSSSEKNYLCWGMLPSSIQLSTLGTMQQANIRFVYDISHHQLHFAPENCLRD